VKCIVGLRRKEKVLSCSRVSGVEGRKSVRDPCNSRHGMQRSLVMTRVRGDSLRAVSAAWKIPCWKVWRAYM